MFDFLKTKSLPNQSEFSEPLNRNGNGHFQTDGPSEDVFIEKGAPRSGNTTETLETNQPINNIDLLYRFLDKNYEEKGYNDALVNPDAHHLEQNLEVLKYELERVIKKVKTFYEDFIKEINYHIDSRSRSGMVDTVEELKMKKDIALGHVEKIIDLESAAKEKKGDGQGIMVSYTKGFKNGLAAISHYTILQRKF